MRRGRLIIIAAAVFAVAAFAAVPGTAFAATPQDICQDLQDGKVDGTYTQAEWTAFFQDSTVQGYCSPVIVVTPPPATGTPPSTPPSTPSTPATPATPSTPITPATPAAPAVPLTPAPAASNTLPAVVTAVAGARKTIATPAAPTTGVQGANHTVRTPVTRSSAAPIATTKTRGTLPFTGAQLSLFLLVGLALLATGVLLRSTARPRQKR